MVIGPSTATATASAAGTISATVRSAASAMYPIAAGPRADPPRIFAATVGEIGPLRGAAEIAFDTILHPEWLRARI